jgi:hypothetical protein
MLAEIFVLRLEAIARSNSANDHDWRFVPVTSAPPLAESGQRFGSEDVSRKSDQRKLPAA